MFRYKIIDEKRRFGYVNLDRHYHKHHFWYNEEEKPQHCDYLNSCFKLLLKRNRSKIIEENKDNYPILKLVFAPKNLKCLKINNDCFSISNSVFNDMKNLTSMDYMDGLTNYIINFPNYSHYYTSYVNNITHIKISGNFSYIEEKAFSYFESLEIVEFGETTNILFIPKFAFLGCKKLKKITISSSCISIEEGSFKDCIKIKVIQFKMNKSIKNYSCLRYIKKEAFYNCSSLKSIVFPPSLIALCESAFMNCTSLEKVMIGIIIDNKFRLPQPDEEKLKIIEKYVFKNCINLLSFRLPQSCVYMGPSSFMNCKKMETFEYKGKELNSIPARCFLNCSSLKQIEFHHFVYKNNNDQMIIDNKYRVIRNIKKEQDYYPFSIGAESFMNCISLISVIIEDESKSIETIIMNNSKIKFIYPIHLVMNDFGPKKKIIHKKAFLNCRSLKNARFFLGNLECICENTFENCFSLLSIELNSQYVKLLFKDNYNSTSFLEIPNELQIKLYNENKLIELIKKPTETTNHLYHRRHFKEHLTSLDNTFFNQFDADNNNNNI